MGCFFARKMTQGKKYSLPFIILAHIMSIVLQHCAREASMSMLMEFSWALVLMKASWACSWSSHKHVHVEVSRAWPPYFILNNQYMPPEPPSVEGRRWAGFQGRSYYFLHQHSVVSLTHQAVQNNAAGFINNNNKLGQCQTQTPISSKFCVQTNFGLKSVGSQ